MFEVASIRNVALVSHGGAGKTSLVEGMLFDSGATERVGKVDEGTTTTDYLPQEIERKMSISLALAAATWRNYKINLIDTPGYADFVGEVKRALRIVESCIVVVDATEGVEVGTEMVWKYADDVELPRVVFINKMDKENAAFYEVIEKLKEIFGANLLLTQIPIGEKEEFCGIIDLLHLKAYIYKDGRQTEDEIPETLREKVAQYRENLIEKIAEVDDSLMEKYLEEETLSEEEVKSGFAAGVKGKQIVPILCGSAYKGIGISPLLDLIVTSLPSPTDVGYLKGVNPKTNNEEERAPSKDEPLSAFVFKVITDPYVGELTLFRVYSGSLRVGSEVYNSTQGRKDKIAHICFLQGKNRREVGDILAGDIGAIVKLRGTNTSDTLCDAEHPIILAPIEFPKPILSLAVNPKTKADQEKLSTALGKLKDEDPTFTVKLEHELGQTIISGMGELHVEIMLDRLTKEFGVDVKIERPKIPYRETITQTARGEGKYKKQSGGRGQYGHAFLEIQPLPRGSGFEFVDKIFGGAIPAKYIPAVEKGVREALERGILAGYPIIDIRVILYDGSFHTVDSSDLAFSIAGSFALKKAFEEARGVLLEPIMDVDVIAPEEYMGDIISDLNGKRGKIQGMEPCGTSQKVKALVPQAEMYKYSTTLRSITRGRGVYTMNFSHYEEVPPHIAEKIIAEAKKSKED